MTRAVAGILIGCMLLFAAACGGKSENVPAGATGTAGASSEGAGADAGPITIGVSVPVAQFMPAFLAEKEDRFEEQGLDVDVKVVPSAQLLSALTSGSIQFAISSGPQLELGALKGPIKLLAVWAHSVDAYVVAAPEIDSMQDLKGKVLGVGVVGSLTPVFAGYALRQAGLTPGDDVRLVPFPSKGPTQAFINGQVDAVVAAPPLTLIEKRARPGAHFVYDFHDLPWTGAELAGNASWIEQHRDATLGVIRALDSGLRAWNDDPKAAKAVIAKQAQSDEHEVVDASYASTQRIFLDHVEPVTQELEEGVLDVLSDDFPQASPDSAASIVAPEYVQQALGSDGG